MAQRIGNARIRKELISNSIQLLLQPHGCAVICPASHGSIITHDRASTSRNSARLKQPHRGPIDAETGNYTARRAKKAVSGGTSRSSRPFNAKQGRFLLTTMGPLARDGVNGLRPLKAPTTPKATCLSRVGRLPAAT